MRKDWWFTELTVNMVLMLLLSALLLTLASELRGYLVVTSRPWPCRVFVNSRELGTTGAEPLRISLPPGLHVLKLVYNELYEVYEKGVVIRAGQETIINVTLKLSTLGRYEVGLKALKEGKWKVARSYLSELASLYLRSNERKRGKMKVPKEVVFYQGVAEFMLGRYPQAGYWFKSYLSLEPKSISARILLGVTKARLGYPRQGLKELYRVATNDEFTGRVMKEFYLKLLSSNWNEEKMRTFEEGLLKQLPYLRGMDKAAAYVKLSDLYLYRGNARKAFDYLLKALKGSVEEIYEP